VIVSGVSQHYSQGVAQITRSGSDHKKKMIAIVDDDESVQSALQDLVEAAGHLATSFGSAEAFLDSGQRRDAACLITDIRMPGMSGLELQAKLRAEQSKIPIIFITAHGDEKMRMQAMRAGAVDFLTKPFDEKVLLDCVEAALAT
jgi:FixJ family two-component response regulator